jgi:hypothetical protein
MILESKMYSFQRLILLNVVLPLLITLLNSSISLSVVLHSTTKSPLLPGGEYFHCLSVAYQKQLSAVPQVAVDIKDIKSLENIDTSLTANNLVKITGLPFGLWNQTIINKNAADKNIKIETLSRKLMILLKSKYGKEIIKWHFAGEGSQKLDSLSNHKKPSMFLKFEDALSQMFHQQQKQQSQRFSSLSDPVSTTSTSPTFFNRKINDQNNKSKHCQRHFDRQLLQMNLTTTPLYAFSSTGFFMVMETINPATGEIMAVDWPIRKHCEVAEKMSNDHFFSSKLLEKQLPVFVKQVPKDIDLYFGSHMSGTYFHTHGPAVASTTGNKFWMFFTPEMQRKLATIPNVLHDAGLSPICSERNGEKYQPNASLCFGQLHPLEILRAYDTMQELGIAPFLLLQRPEEILVIPENWMHGTINLEECVSVSYRFFTDHK